MTEDDEAAEVPLKDGPVRARLVLLLPAIALAFFAVFGALMSLWGMAEPGRARLRDASGALLTSAGIGVLATALLLTALGRRAVSPWLVLGVVPALWAGAVALGG